MLASMFNVWSDTSMLAGSDMRSVPASKVQIFCTTKRSGGDCLTFGDMVFLAGDYYGLKNAPISSATSNVGAQRRFLRHVATMKSPRRGEIRKLLNLEATFLKAAKRKIRQGKPAEESMGGVPALKFAVGIQRATGGLISGRFLQLKYTSFDHFGADAKRVYLIGHGLAMRKAVRAKRQARGGRCGTACTATLNEAYSLEAYSQHYLSDRFSTGHLRVPSRALSATCPGRGTPEAKYTRMAVRRHQSLFLRRVWGKVKSKFKSAGRKLKRAAGRTLRKLKKKLRKLGGKVAAKICKYAISAMHDQESADGLWISSKNHPTPWKGYGDKRYWSKKNRLTHLRVLEAGQAGIDEVAASYRTARVQSTRMADYFPEAVPTGNRRYPNPPAKFITRRGKVYMRYKGRYIKAMNGSGFPKFIAWGLKVLGKKATSPFTKMMAGRK